jgi:putative ABC transport system permease protein
MRAAGRLFFYDLRMALVSLRRDPALSLAMFVCLALGAGMWTAITSHYLRDHEPRPTLSPGLSQVEVEHPRGRALYAGTRWSDSAWQARLRVSYPEYEALASHQLQLGVRQTATFRAPLLVASDRGAAQVRAVRFVEPGFFDLFALPLGKGTTWDGRQPTPPVAVVGRRLARELFGDEAVGQTLLIEGQPFRVVGQLAREQGFRPEWDLSTINTNQDALYLPFGWGRRLDVWPEHVLMQTPLPRRAQGQAPAHDETPLWQSDALFVGFWIDLPTPAARDAYQQHLKRALSVPYTLRDRAAWLAAFPIPESDIFFYAVLLAVGLLGAAFSTARLLLAKGLARAELLGIFRALGATRLDLFNRQLLEGALIALPAALVGVLIALFYNTVFNRVALQNDVPVVLSPLALLLGIAPSFLVGLLAAAYPAWRMSRTPPTVVLGRL